LTIDWRKFDESIYETVNDFLEAPYSYYSENDIHCKLYLNMCKVGLNQPCLVSTPRGAVPSTILHKEYPTKGKYRRNNRGPSEKIETGSRGHFDLCLWDPDVAATRLISSPGGVGEQRTIGAVEMSMNEHHERFLWHALWDRLKLSDPANEVEHGVILFFVRDYQYESTGFPKDGFFTSLYEHFKDEEKVCLIYVERRGAERIVYVVSKTSFQGFKNYNP